MPKVHLPNGKTINFPDNTPEAEIKSAIDQAMGGESEDFEARAASMSPQDIEIARTKNDPFGEFLREQAKQPQEGETEEARFRRLYGGLSMEERPGAGEGVARSALQGMTFGFGDEMVAAAAAAVDPLAKGSGGTFGDRYNAYLSRERERLGQFREDRPVAAYGTEIAGAIPTAVMTAPAGVPASLGGRVAAGAATGAAQGGIYGFGAGEGGAEQRGEEAAKVAALGGGIGAAAPAVGAGARNIAERVTSGRAARQLGTTPPAYRVLERAAAADDTLTGEGARRVERAGEGAMLADAGPNMRTLLDTAMQKSGAAATKARKAIEGRASAAGKSLAKALDDILGKPQGIKTAETALRTGTQAARSSAYQTAYRQPVDYSSLVGQQIEDVVINRVPMSAIRRANALMRVEGQKSRQILAQVGDDGTVVFKRMPDVRQLDYITRGLQEVADAQNAKGALGGTTDIGRAYAGLKRELRGLVREAVPEYGTALDTAADPISKRAALRIGERALSARVARDEFADEIAGMSAAERQFVSQGIRSQIDDALANVRRAMTDTNMDAREAMQAVRILTTRASRDKMEMLLGPERAGRLFNSIDETMMALDLRASVRDNSRTFARLAMDESISGQTDEGVINAIRSGEPIGAGKRAIQAVAGRTAADKERIADETYSALVDALTEPRGSRALNQVKAMEIMNATRGLTTEQAQRLGEFFLRSNIGITGPATQALPEQ